MKLLQNMILLYLTQIITKKKDDGLHQNLDVDNKWLMQEFWNFSWILFFNTSVISIW